ncbi:MAG: rRNA maturation RNase YbeY [Burkholderiales bacterium]|nr:rRNA maturation RNase YbeY [Phycisphaerae bacterium]
MAKTKSAGVVLTVTARVGKPLANGLRLSLLRAVEMLPHAPAELSVALVGDAEMSGLHEQFMGITGPTDVLSFELDHDARGRVTSGEIVVCVPEARRQARSLGHPLTDELLLYALHGVLHLSGYDDKTDSAYRRMHRTEDRILTQLGVGKVFSRGSTRQRPKPRLGKLSIHKSRGTV